MQFLETFLFQFPACLPSFSSHDWKQNLPSKQILPLCHDPLDPSTMFPPHTLAGCQNSPCSQPRTVQRKVSYKFSPELNGKAGFPWLISPLQWRHEWEYWPAFLAKPHKPGHVLSTGCIFQLNWNKIQPYLILVAETSRSSLHPQVLHWFWAWISFPALWVIQ